MNYLGISHSSNGITCQNITEYVFYNILENYKVLHSLGKSVQTSQILMQLIQSYSKKHIFNGL